MKKILVDTGAWVAMEDRGDSHHGDAMRFKAAIAGEYLIFFDEAWTVFERFNRDKQWSFTDCTTYALMKQMSMVEVFAFDRHFDQMGFRRSPTA
jgi:predicted nucleic acid-binding protein